MGKVLPVLLLVLLIPIGYYAMSSGAGHSSDSGVEAPHGVSLRLDKSVYSPRDTMTITVTNSGNLSATTSYHFKLYRQEGGEWREVPVNLMVIEMAVVIEPGKSWEQRIDLSDLNLKPGHYRIVKTFSFTEPTNKTAASVEAWAEFDVKG